MNVIAQISAAQRTGNTLLGLLPARERDTLLARAEPIALAQDAILFAPGDRVDHVVFPENGTMVSLATPLGVRQAAETATIGRDGSVGLVAAFGDRVMRSRATVVLPGPALRIEAAQLLAAARRLPAVRDLVGRYAQASLNEAMQLAACNARHPVEQRLCRWILNADDCRRAGSGDAAAALPLPLTQEGLGETLGVQRTTITVVAMRLQQQGFLHYARGRVHVLDRPGLEDAACECRAAIKRFRALPPCE